MMTSQNLSLGRTSSQRPRSNKFGTNNLRTKKSLKGVRVMLAQHMFLKEGVVLGSFSVSNYFAWNLRQVWHSDTGLALCHGNFEIKEVSTVQSLTPRKKRMM